MEVRRYVRSKEQLESDVGKYLQEEGLYSLLCVVRNAIKYFQGTLQTENIDGAVEAIREILKQKQQGRWRDV